jgi:flagellar motility protein MotE (MotC chaperone)
VTDHHVTQALVEHQAESIEDLHRALLDMQHQRDSALRLLSEQAEAMKAVYRENRELKKVLQVRADMQQSVDQVNSLTAEQFRVTIERVQ